MKKNYTKKLLVVVVALSAIAVITFAYSSSESLQGRLSMSEPIIKGESGSTHEPGEVIVKSDLSGFSMYVDYEPIINGLSDEADELSAEFAVFKEDYYFAFIDLMGAADSYQDYEDTEEFRSEALDGYYEIQDRFADFFERYEAIDEDELSTYEGAIFGDFKNKVTEDIAYTEATQEYTLEDIYTLMIPGNIDYLKHVNLPAYGDLEITDISVTVGADGNLHFILNIVNNEDESATETRPMPVGNIDLEGIFRIAGIGSSYFGIEISYDEEIEPGNSANVEGTLAFASRTEDIYNAYLNGESMHFDVTGYVNYTSSISEYDFDNNVTEATFTVL